jgi:hypothetical protein
VTDQECLDLLAKHVVVLTITQISTIACCSCGGWRATDFNPGIARLRVMRAFHNHCVKTIDEVERGL